MSLIKIITEAKEDLQNMDYGEVHLALEKIERKIGEIHELIGVAKEWDNEVVEIKELENTLGVESS